MSGHHFRGPAREWAGPLGARVALPAALLVSVSMLAEGGAEGSNTILLTTTVPGPAVPFGQWPYPNGDLANTRVAPGL